MAYIMPHNTIYRPKLRGDAALTAKADVEKIINQARDNINETPAPIQIKLCKNHATEATGKTIQAKNFHDITNAAKKLYNLVVKRIYTKKGKIIFNFGQVRPFIFVFLQIFTDILQIFFKNWC